MSKAAVIGAGLMGRRIAGVMARAGVDVVLIDTLEQVLADGRDVAIEMAQGRGAVTTSTDVLSAVVDVDFVTEAVVEDLGVKNDIVVAISKVNADAIIATNTSVLPITSIAEGTISPERVVGTHWWNPPDLIPIVEVVRGAQTSDSTMEDTYMFLAALGKTPVRIERDVAGFVGNRLQHALWREAISLVAEGVCDAETVDLVCRNTIGLRLAEMGPIENADYVGLDLTLAIHRAVIPALNADPDAHPYLAGLVASGDLGAKSGRGFLTWEPGSRDLAAQRLSQHIVRQLEIKEKS
jgi:3-hydroxybutyryl-CoA dehydrogenase